MSVYAPVIQGLYTPLPSQVRTTTQVVTGKTLIDPTSANTDARFQPAVYPEASGMIAYLNITQASGTGGLSLVLEEIDHVSGATAVMLATLNITTTGLVTLKVKANIAPVVPTTTRAVAQDILPATWRLRVVHGDASNYTYSLGVVLYN